MSEQTALAAVADVAAFAVVPEEDPAPPVTEIICGELRSGKILTTVQAAGATWEQKFNDAGRVETTVPLESPDVDSKELVGYLDGARCFLAARVGDRILEAGPIWAHDWNNDTGQLSVTAAGLWSLWDHRKVLKVLAAGENVAGTSLSWSGMSLGTIAKRLVQEAQKHAGRLESLVLPPDDAGFESDADHTRTWRGYELKDMGEALRQLTEVLNGPDIRFEPRLSADRLRVEWVMRVGTDANPVVAQTGGDWSWNLDVPRGNVGGLSVSRDFTGMAFRAWASGDGMEVDQLIGKAEDLSLTGAAGYPLLEATESHSSVRVQRTLDRHAQALVRRSVCPWVTWSWDTRVGDGFVGEERPGDWARVRVPDDHPYLSCIGVQGVYRSRIVGLSGGLGDVVSVTAAPTMEAR